MSVSRGNLCGRDSFAARESNFAMGVPVRAIIKVYSLFLPRVYGAPDINRRRTKTRLCTSRMSIFFSDEHLVGDAAYSLTLAVITSYKVENQSGRRLPLTTATSEKQGSRSSMHLNSSKVAVVVCTICDLTIQGRMTTHQSTNHGMCRHL